MTPRSSAWPSVLPSNQLILLFLQVHPKIYHVYHVRKWLSQYTNHSLVIDYVDNEYLDLWEIILTDLEGKRLEALYAGPLNGPSRWNSACAVIVSRCLPSVCTTFLVNKCLKLNAVFKTNRTQLNQEFTESYQKHFFLMLSLDIYEFNIIFPWSLLLSDPSFKSGALQAKQEKSNRIIWIIHL